MGAAKTPTDKCLLSLLSDASPFKNVLNPVRLPGARGWTANTDLVNLSFVRPFKD